jgi:hypothetical protein
MKRNSFARVFGVGLLIALSPLPLAAQGTGPTTAPTTSPTTNGGGGGGGGGGQQTAPAQGISAAIGEGFTTKTVVFAAVSPAGSATSIPSNSNMMATTYVQPYSLGMPSLYAGQYGAQNTISKSGGPKGKFTYLYVPAPTGTAATGAAATQATGFTTYGTIRNPVYTTNLGPSFPIVQHQAPKLYGEVKAFLENSTYLKSKENVNVSVSLDGDTIVLAGTVGSFNDRLLVEGILEATPGVTRTTPIRNEITVLNQNR